MCHFRNGGRLVNKTFIAIYRVLVIAVGIFLLAGTIVLKIILAMDLPNEIFMNYINSFEHIYYSVISYDINVLMFFCVPFIDLFIVLKMSKSNKRMKIYLWLLLLIYTSFFVLRLTTLQA